MCKTIDFKMWGERGLVATFFMDVCQLTDLRVIADFLGVAANWEFPVNNSNIPEKFTCVIEPNFGNKGFGQPDAILRFDYSARRFVVIVEAKLTGFEEACWQPSRRGEKGFNSKLNGQLELDYRLAMALADFKEGMCVLEESNWVLQSPYCDARILRKDNVLNTVVSKFISEDLRLEDYYYLVITTDDQNPFDGTNEQYLPQLFKVEIEGNKLVFPNRWQELNSRFGWTNYREMVRLIKKIEKQLPTGSMFLPTYEMNKGGFGEGPEDDDNGDGPRLPELRDKEKVILEPPLRGGWVVKFDNKLYHLSCQEYSYKLRHLHGGRWTERELGKKNEQKMRSMLSHVEVIEKNSKTIKDIPYWERRFNELKE
ncbi:MAG TPA: hypothetical protein VMW72_04280 [Sedimentisphaerales bacterium]|nr:hypothetical protein [Sedimentisphaerales bacterium]